MKNVKSFFTLSLLTLMTQTVFGQQVNVDSSAAIGDEVIVADEGTVAVDPPVAVQPVTAQEDQGIIIIGPDGKQYNFDAKNANEAPIIVRDLVKPYLVPETHLDREDLYFIGVTLKSVPAEYQALVGAEHGFGLMVTGIIDDAPADLAGIQKYDVILKANDEPIKSVAQIQSVFRLSENTPVHLTIRRKLETIHVEIQAILWESLNDEAKIALRPRGVRCIPEYMEPYLRRQYIRDMKYLNGDLDDELLLHNDVASETDVERLQKDINVLRGEFEARQELMLKKLDELQAGQNEINKTE